ncbi:sigma 54-interacting transcriptional regulator [Oceanobacillus sp. FSL W7-1293]|uniref:sigma 54-interacting transcriptional regulator n=1 Tax=Oceanobacillus sp. FSL W7-1293 TaxID=2921699 RepID=UPI0030CC7031
MLQMNSQELLNEENGQAGNWMKRNPEVICLNETVKAAAELLHNLAADFLPVVGESMNPVGIITSKAILKAYLDGGNEASIANYISQEDFSIIRADEFIIDFYKMPYTYFFAVNEKQQLTGVLTRKEIQQCLSFYMNELSQTSHTAEILDVILESAYEGVAVVNQEGIIIEFNEAYSRFTGIDQKDAIGRPVQEIIENTNLHHTARNGMPERGVIQYIQGQPMVVHRIPIWREEKLVGAIGMLIFEGVTELYQIYDRFLEKTMQTAVNKDRVKQPLQENRIEHASIEKIKGSSEQITDLKRITRKVAKTDATALITGESGTGKEMFAKSIHELSYYQNGPFISVNCGAIPEQLFESEVFGYADGAFTGARKGGKPGKLALAKGGTLFLDEIGEMPEMMQTKLLRVLQEKEFERVGAVQKEKLEARIVVATNQNLLEMVREGTFREDLYYRINVIEIPIPPLRERPKDIPVLISHYLSSLCKKYNVPDKEVTPEAMAVFMNYAWYGNIRELINTMEKLVILVESDTIDVDHLPNYLKRFDLLETSYVFQREVKNKEKEVLMKALEENRGNKSKAAKELGIHRTTLYKKLKKHGLDK